MYHVFFAVPKSPLPPAVRLITAVRIVLVEPHQRTISKRNPYSRIEQKHCCTCNMGKRLQISILSVSQKKGVNLRHRKSRPGIPRVSPRFVFQFARGAANHFLRKNLRNLPNGTMVATVACRYFPSAKRRS